MAKMSNTKGKSGELEVAFLLRKYGFEARRGQQFSGGDGSPDVVHNIPGVHIEVKRAERFSLYAAMDQASEDTKTCEQIPVVFHRMSRRPWVVVIDAEDFLRILQKLKDYSWPK